MTNKTHLWDGYKQRLACSRSGATGFNSFAVEFSEFKTKPAEQRCTRCTSGKLFSFLLRKEAA